MTASDPEPAPRVSPGGPHLVRFDGVAAPFAFHDGTEDLLGPLAKILRGWPRRAAGTDDAPPLAHIRRRDETYRIEAPWLAEPVVESCLVRALGNLAVDVVEAYLHTHASRLCLHCGAVERDGRLVVFPSRSRAGKSTLMARLAAEGMPVFTDDVLPLSESDRDGISLGIPPRLRLPLPARASAQLRAFVSAHGGLGDEDYLYLDPPPPASVPYGRALPLGAIVLLDRREDGSARLVPAGRGEGLHELIVQNLAPTLGKGEAVPRLRDLVAALPCFTLVYSDLEDAAATIRAAFDDWARIAALAPAAARVARPEAGPQAADLPPAPPAARLYRRADNVVLHEIEDTPFLVDASGDAVFRLNPVALGVWNLLAVPLSPEQALAILAQAFPDDDPGCIASDVGDLFAALGASGLIVPHGEPPG